MQKVGTKPDLEIIGLIAREMKADLNALGRWTSESVFAEIQREVRGYNVPLWTVAQTVPLNGRVEVAVRPELVESACDTLYTSGTLGRYSNTLNSVRERGMKLYEG
jgi:NADH-quinone oxidoreductase subunit G